MRHRVKKIKFKKGKDAAKMTARKLINNFLLRGKIKTTLKKAKILKSLIDKVVSQAKKNKKEWLMKKLANEKTVKLLLEKIVPVFKKRESGFTTMKKILPRLSDGSVMATLSWVEPVVISENKKGKEKNAQTNQNNQAQVRK